MNNVITFLSTTLFEPSTRKVQSTIQQEHAATTVSATLDLGIDSTYTDMYISLISCIHEVSTSCCRQQEKISIKWLNMPLLLTEPTFRFKLG